MSTITVAEVRPLSCPSVKVPRYRICTRCVMDTSDAEIRFAENGHCNHCIGYFERAARELPPPEEANRRLRSLVDRIKGEGTNKEYDCVIGVSGGVDSTYTAYAVKRLGLRPLAVHLDNGWNSELAVDNIKHTLEILGIDLFTHVIDWQEFKDLQLSFLRASVPDTEVPTDHAIFSVLLNTAYERGIRYVLTGSNVATEAIMPPSWNHNKWDLKHLRAIHRQFGKRKLRTFPQLGAARFLYYVLVKRIKYVPILNLLGYDKQIAKDVITRELGWRDYGGKHFESVFTRFYQGYILLRKFGYDKRRAHLSTLICAGTLTREEALRELEKHPYDGYDLEGEIHYVAKKFGLTVEAFEELLQRPPKRHLDYPANRLLFHRLHNLRAVVKQIARTG